jgi:hypothetical protein
MAGLGRATTRLPRITFSQLLAFVAVALPVLAVLSLPSSIIDLAYLDQSR